jgi:hypothetical protein
VLQMLERTIYRFVERVDAINASSPLLRTGHTLVENG